MGSKDIKNDVVSELQDALKHISGKEASEVARITATLETLEEGDEFYAMAIEATQLLVSIDGGVFSTLKSDKGEQKHISTLKKLLSTKVKLLGKED